MTPRPRTLELLVEHGAFLRRLAGGLARSDADADDLVQDTWVSALERPPRTWEAPRGWLGTAARRLSWKRERASRRRAAREAEVARDEAVEQPHDAALVLRDVVEAVLALEPAQRAVVTARFFEDLSLREVAEREGLSVPAVKGRLRRALETLRGDLDDRHGGDRRAWCAPLLAAAGVGRGGPTPLAPAGSGTLTMTLATGALVMSMKAKIALALSAALAIVWGAFSLGDGDIAERIAPAERAHVRGDSDIAGAVGPEREQRTRASAASEPEVAPAPVAVGPVATLEVLATDQDGLPVPGVEVYAAPPAQPLNRVGETDARGRFDVSWVPAGAPGELVVQLRAANHDLTGLRRFTIPRAGRRVLRCAIDPALLPQPGMISFTIHRATGSTTDRVLYAEGGLVDVIGVAPLPGASDEQHAPRRRRGPLEPSVEPDLHGGAPRFVSGELHAPASLRYASNAEIVDLSGFVVSAEFPHGGDVAARLSGVVFDRTGRPAPGVRVAARLGEEIVARTRSGQDGTYDLGVPAGALTLLAGDDDAHGARKELVTLADDQATWDPIVERGLVLSGVARGVDAPLTAGIVRASHELSDGLWIGAARTTDQGLFAIPHCPAQVVSVDVTHTSRPLPLVHHEAVATGGDVWEVDVDLASHATVRFTPRDEDPHGPLAGELRVWDASGRRGARVPLRGTAGEPVQVSFSPGTWNIALGARGPHWGRLVPVNVAAGDDVDLGALSFESTGWLELAPCPEGETVRVVRAGDGGAVLLPRESVLSDALLLSLPPGTYRVERTSADGRVRSETLEVRVAQRTSEAR